MYKCWDNYEINSLVMLLNRFYEVTLTIDHKKQFFLDYKCMFVPKLETFSHSFPDILQEWARCA